MWQRCLAVLLFFLVLLAGDARAELCTSQTSGNVSGVADCTIFTPSCTCDATDDFLIASPHVATVTGDFTMTDTAGTGLTVASGASLLVPVASVPLTLTLSEDGLDCQAGSICTLTGAYLESGVASPGLVNAPQSFPLGRPENGAGGSTVVIEWDSAIFNAEIAGKGDPFVWESINQIAAGDIGCFWDFDTTTPSSPTDHAYCYEVTAVSMAGDPRTVTLDVRQGIADHAGFPLTRRDIVQTTLSNAEPQGSRVIELPDLVITADGLHRGRWLRFATGGVEEASAFRILASDATADTVTLADLRGLNKDHAAAENVWIDYGWTRGDELFFYRPVVLTSATLPSVDSRDSPVNFLGTTSLDGVLIAAMQNVDVDGTIAKWTHVWQRDTGGAGGATLQIDNVSTAFSFLHYTFTGLDEDAGAVGDGGRTHGLILSDVSADVLYEDIAFRHHGDDAIGSSQTNPLTGDLTIHRIRGQFITDTAQSAEFMNFANATGRILVNDWECADCAGDAVSGVAQVFGGGGGSSTVRRGIALGADARLGNLATGPADWFYDWQMLGGTPDTNSTIIPPNSDRWVAREVICSSDQNCQGIPFPSRNGYFDTVTTGDDPIRISSAGVGEMVNVAVIDHTTDGVATNDGVVLVSYPFAGLTATLTRVLFAWRDGVQTLDESVFRFSGTPNGDEVINLEGVGIAGYDYDPGGGGVADLFNGDNTARIAPVTAGTTLCLWRNDTNHGTDMNTKAGTVVVGVHPGFNDEARGDFSIPKGEGWDASECGIKTGKDAPGLHATSHPHSWSRLEPENLGGFIAPGGGALDGGPWPHPSWPRR